MFCPNCGIEIENGSQICKNCGGTIMSEIVPPKVEENNLQITPDNSSVIKEITADPAVIKVTNSIWPKSIFQGRLCRKNFFMGGFVGGAVLYIIFLSLSLIIPRSGSGLLYINYFLLCFVSLSLLIRRHHDLNQHWFYPLLVLAAIGLLGLINDTLASLVSILYSLILLIIKGGEGDNNFGSPDDKKRIRQIFGLIK